MGNRKFVLDGTNIALLHGRQRPRLGYVLALWHHLRSHSSVKAIHCYFDANTSYVLREFAAEQSRWFTIITEEDPWTAYFHVVPSGTQADEWILRHAKTERAEVVSNDRFKDRARKNPWIWKRRHEFAVSEHCLTVPSLGAVVEISPDPGFYLQKHC